MTPEPLSLFDDRARPPFPRPVETVQLAARMTDPDTSVAAAASITPGRTEAAILDGFRRQRAVVARIGGDEADEGYTDDELVAQMAPEHYSPTVKSARSRLSNAGLLVDSGTRRPSSRGREMIVWRLA